jgi:hypothetical protein
MTSRKRPWTIAGRARGAPPTTGDKAGRGRPQRSEASSMPSSAADQRSPGTLARIGAPPLIALASALGLLALLICALFVPGFVLHADAGTTTSTETAPGGAGTTTTVTVPAEPLPVEPAQGRRLVTLPWGAGAGEVGLALPTEGLTRGPGALAVAPDGRIAILDSVNSRLVLLTAEGSFTSTVPLPLSQARFLAVDDSRLYVLDDSAAQLVCLDWQGSQLHSAQVTALDDVVTGLFATDDGPCVEVAHDDVFLVEFKDKGNQAATANRAGRVEKPAVAALHAVAGRPLDRDLGKTAKLTFKAKDGVKLKRYKVDRKTFKAIQTAAAAPTLPAGQAIEQLVSLDGDGRGGLIVGARLLHSKGDRANAPSLVVGRLTGGADGSGEAPALIDMLILCDSPFAYLGQPYIVAPDGQIFQPVGGAAGYTVFVYSLPGSLAAAANGSATTAIEEVQP